MSSKFGRDFSQTLFVEPPEDVPQPRAIYAAGKQLVQQSLVCADFKSALEVAAALRLLH